MTQKDNDSITIPQEKLLDFFMHTATRQDVAELRNETHHQFSDMKQEFTALRKETNTQFVEQRKLFQQDMSNFRNEVKQDMSNLRAEVKQDMSNLRAEVKQDIADLKTELKEDQARIEKRCDKLGLDLHDVFTHLSDKIDSNFKWTMGILIVSILSPIALHFVT